MFEEKGLRRKAFAQKNTWEAQNLQSSEIVKDKGDTEGWKQVYLKVCIVSDGPLSLFLSKTRTKQFINQALQI